MSIVDLASAMADNSTRTWFKERVKHHFSILVSQGVAPNEAAVQAMSIVKQEQQVSPTAATTVAKRKRTAESDAESNPLAWLGGDMGKFDWLDAESVGGLAMPQLKAGLETRGLSTSWAQLTTREIGFAGV